MQANRLPGRFGPGAQFREVVIHTRDAEIRLAPEWLAQVMNLMGLAIEEFDHRQNEILRLVQAVHYLILRHGYGLRVGDAALHFQQSKAPRRAITTLDIVTKFLVFTIDRFESEFALDLHDDRSRSRGRCLRIDR